MIRTALRRGTALTIAIVALTGLCSCGTPDDCASTRTCAGPHSKPVPEPSPGPIAPLRSLGDGTLTQRLDRVKARSTVILPATATSFGDFTRTADSAFIGVDVPPAVGGIEGSAHGGSIIRIDPMSSTHASDIPTTFPQSNRLSLLRVVPPTRFLRDFTLQGTDQGHSYNGLSIARTDGEVVSGVKVLAIPGDDHQPPGETFGISDYRTRNSVYRDVVVDGAGVGGAGLGANVSKRLTVEHSTFTRNRYSAGATFWEVDDVTLDHVTSTDNGLLGLNFERVGGTVTIIRPTLRRNGGGDLRIASDFGSAQYVIRDPVTDDGMLHVVLPREYDGRPNLQRATDIRVIVHGADVTTRLLRIVGD